MAAGSAGYFWTALNEDIGIALVGAVPSENARRLLIGLAKAISDSVMDGMEVHDHAPEGFEDAARTALLQLAGTNGGLAALSNRRFDLILSDAHQWTESTARKKINNALPSGFDFAFIFMDNRRVYRHSYHPNYYRRGHYRRGGGGGIVQSKPPTPFSVVGLNDAAAVGTEDPRVIDLLYATDRKLEDNDRFSGERASTMTFGAARIRIPEDHKLGRIELPVKYTLLTFMDEKEDPNKHFIVQARNVLTRDEWDGVIRDLKPTDALVFVHGYNTSFEDALLREAQIVWDLQFTGLPVLFSWPSRGSSLQYEYDRESAQFARSDFIDLLKILKKEHGIERVHVLAHSMGNYVVLDALSAYSQTQDPVRISQVIMAAPDVDSDQFKRIVPQIETIVGGMTLYASSADRALKTSKVIVGNIPRAGDVPSGGPIVLPGLEFDRRDRNRRGDVRPQSQHLRHRQITDRRYRTIDLRRAARSPPVTD